MAYKYYKNGYYNIGIKLDFNLMENIFFPLSERNIISI